uniref:Putative ovule protein n=1 Tax=Solanum chacoense TaxID=4108 RepID=A0A0V0GHH4_SOLCH
MTKNREIRHNASRKQEQPFIKNTFLLKNTAQKTRQKKQNPMTKNREIRHNASRKQEQPFIKNTFLLKNTTLQD